MDYNAEEFSQSHKASGYEQELDYAHPSYYGIVTDQGTQTVQSGERLNNYHDVSVDTPYAEAEFNSSSPMSQMQEYRGPQDLEGYTQDIGEEQREAAREGQEKQRGSVRKGLTGIGSLGVALLGWLAKLKGLAVLLKFGTLGFSALLSAAVYSLFFGWSFGIGLVVLLFIHEMGHAVVMKLKGIPIGGMIFIPMLGAAVTMKQMPQNAKDEAEVGIAGPIAGALAAGVCLLIAQVYPHTVWAPLAYFGFFMNLFNLAPIVPMDGGRVLAAIDRRVWILGFLGLLAYQIWSWIHGNASLWLLFIVFMAATQLWSRGFKSNSPESQEYYTVPMNSRILLSIMYFGLAIVLFLGMSLAHSIIPAI